MLFKRINLEFFKGGSTTTQVQKRDPKSAELISMDSTIYSLLSPIATRYGGSPTQGVSMPSYSVAPVQSGGQPSISPFGMSRPGSNNYSGSWDGGYNTHGDYTGNGNYNASGQYVGRKPSRSVLSSKYGGSVAAPVASQWGSGSVLSQNYDLADQQAAVTNANILDLLQSTPQYLDKHQAFMQNGTDAGFENFLSGSEQAIANAYSKNVGTDLNSMASKGIINSSVTNRALANQQAETANAIAANRNEGAGIWMDNYLSGYKTGMEGLDTMSDLPTKYYQNALAPIMPLYNYWKDMTDAYYGHEDYDTVVSSGGK